VCTDACRCINGLNKTTTDTILEDVDGEDEDDDYV
jgi:hypothetical protein